MELERGDLIYQVVFSVIVCVLRLQEALTKAICQRFLRISKSETMQCFMFVQPTHMEDVDENRVVAQ